MEQDETIFKFYAHSQEVFSKKKWEALIDHLKETAIIASRLGADARVSDFARITALAHDLGKYSIEFQHRLEGKNISVDHSTAGAKELLNIYKGTSHEPIVMLLSYCIVGHHTGLLDYGDSSDVPGDNTLMARLKTNIFDYSAYLKELDLAAETFPDKLSIRLLPGHPAFSVGFHTRMIYSTLVDADFLETERAMRGKVERGNHKGIDELCRTFNVYIRKFDNPQREIDKKRTETLKTCMRHSIDAPGFFSLTVPTGGGKTLASMAFALNHATENHQRRIIYVIPYTTIIEQNAGVFKGILGDENILEHHSNFDWEKKRRTEDNPDDQTNSAYSKIKLAAENWDVPIIVTTNVQFFESLFANKSRRCRKLHNLAKSVIIFDEAQMLPREYLFPALSAVWELVTNYGASAVFCTATQPDLGRFLPKNTNIVELAPNPQELFDFYHRVDIAFLGKITDEELIERLKLHPQALCIVNTRKHAKGLFDLMQKEGGYHLSTLMCPVHRKGKLTEIRQRLADGQDCRVVSTTVMEAGVDLDFPVGYRAISGLDSINQAAGRVNREMRLTVGHLYVFEPDSEYAKHVPKFIGQMIEVGRSILRDHPSKPISIEAIHAYFERLYSLKDPQEFDSKKILDCFDNNAPTKLNFAEAASKFQFIEDITVPVIIPFNEEAKGLIAELKVTPYPFAALRKLQPYTVNIYEKELAALQTQGVIENIADAYSTLTDMKYYDSHTGLIIPIDQGGSSVLS